MGRRDLAAILVGAALLSGCGSKASGICSAQTECEGGNDRDTAACEALTDGAGDVASAYDCSDAFEKALDCIEKTGTCKNQHYQNECLAEGTALTTCESAASGKK